jgi:F420-non-reducing hydrogenase iron-sulfur subunit
MTTKRIAVMKQLLAFTGIEQDRLQLEWVSAAEGPKFAQAITEFTNLIKALGPSRLKVAA